MTEPTPSSVDVALERVVTVVRLATTLLNGAALAALAGAAITWLAILPWILDGPAPAVVGAVALVVLAAPATWVVLYVRQVRRIYGDADAVRAELRGAITSSTDAVAQLATIKLPERTGRFRKLRVAIAAIRRLRAIYTATGVATHVERLAAPFEARRLAITALAASAGLWISVLALPVALVSVALLLLR
jgi:hypothetical protein